MASIPQTYSIADFLQWQRQKQLVLDPKFQRGSVWTPQAQTFLIDTILRGYPIPPIYLRTRVNSQTQKSVREVVDGQQRLRAIIAFADNEIRLGTRIQDFGGKRYGDLTPDQQDSFLSYSITAVQLLNSSDAEVLEVFARLNSYSVKVTPAELRHAKFDEPVKWAIWNTTREWGRLWDEYHVVSVRDSVRLKNTSLVAELFMALKDGLGDGGEDKITKFYTANKKTSDSDFEVITGRVNEAINVTVSLFGGQLADTTYFSAPNFLILVSAVAFLTGTLPDSPVTSEVQELKGKGIAEERSVSNLGLLSTAIENEDIQGPFGPFVLATKSSTQRINSRKTRFVDTVRAMST